MLYEGWLPWSLPRIWANSSHSARSLVVAGQSPWASIRLFGRMSVQFFSM